MTCLLCVMRLYKRASCATACWGLRWVVASAFGLLPIDHVDGNSPTCFLGLLVAVFYKTFPAQQWR